MRPKLKAQVIYQLICGHSEEAAAADQMDDVKQTIDYMYLVDQ